MEYLNIVYIVLWGLIALYCFISAHRLGNILYIAGVFFSFMFGWYLANQLIDINLFDGIYNIIFRCIAIGFLVIIGGLYFLMKKKSEN